MTPKGECSDAGGNGTVPIFSNCILKIKKLITYKYLDVLHGFHPTLFEPDHFALSP